MSAHARKALERVGERFREAETAGNVVGSELIESTIPQRHGIISRPPGRFADKRRSSYLGNLYREFELLQSSDGSPLFSERVAHYPNGKPIANSAGEPFDFEPGATRAHYTYCEPEAGKLFDRIAAEAGRALHGLPAHLLSLFPLETLIVKNEVLRWIFAVYDLSWCPFPGTPLANPVKMVWANSTKIELASLPRFRRDFPSMDALAAIPDPPDHWFAEIDDLFSVSRAAIDVLLATWDSVPEGWVGFVAPKNLDHLRAYLADELGKISRRAAASPEFRDATEETRFNEVYPRRYWGPYRRYEAKQIRAAVRAIDNANCWLDHHGISLNRPAALSEGDSPGDAERRLAEWLQVVTATDARASQPVSGSTAEGTNVTTDSARSKKPKRSAEGDRGQARNITAAGHLKFLEWVRDEVRYAADCKRRQVAEGYANSTLAAIIDGIKWAEAGDRIARLSDFPVEAVEQVERVLRRELTVGTVEQVDDLLTRAVRALRDAWENADAVATDIEIDRRFFAPHEPRKFRLVCRKSEIQQRERRKEAPTEWELRIPDGWPPIGWKGDAFPCDTSVESAVDWIEFEALIVDRISENVKESTILNRILNDLGMVVQYFERVGKSGAPDIPDSWDSRHQARFGLSRVAGWLRAGVADMQSTATGTGRPPKRTKRSTEKGEGRTKIIAALTKHHGYNNGSCANFAPIGNNELAELASVSPSTASSFFLKEFKGHTMYRRACLNGTTLVSQLKLLCGEFSPHHLYGGDLPSERDWDDEE